MKKAVMISVIISFLILIAEATTIIENDPKLTEREKLVDKVQYTNNGYVFLKGFSFKTYEPSGIGIKERVDDEVEYIKNNYKDKDEKERYAIVGHSQGGLRALAYAKVLKEKDPEEYKRLKAVITVSGIDKGLKALDGGFSPFLSKLYKDIEILNNGVKGFVAAAPIMSLILSGAGCIALCANKEEIKNKITEISPIINYVLTAVQGGTEENMQEIYDMMPKSNFINKNVAQIETIERKERTGEQISWGWKSKKVLGIKCYYLSKCIVPTYTVYRTYKDVPLFDKDLPVGFIVGADNNTIGIAENEKEIRTGIKWSAAAFRTAEVIHLARTALVVGLVTGSLKFFNDCDNAALWLENVDDEICELLGSDENDGLVAKESQYYPKTFNPNNQKNEQNETNKEIESEEEIILTKVLGESEKGYIEYSQYNHENINPKDNDTIQKRIIKLLEELD